MPVLRLGHENSAPIELHYEDQGDGRPVVLLHGWPLASSCWEKQRPALLAAGHRVVSVDRRGFGRSSRTTLGLDVDTHAEDLQHLLGMLDLRDATLVGYALGAGDVLRYLGNRGAERVRRAVLIAAAAPRLLRGEGHPMGIDPRRLARLRAGLACDRPACLRELMDKIHNADQLGRRRISRSALRASWEQALEASDNAAFDLAAACGVDFRDDLERIDLPVLVLHGAADRLCPPLATALPLALGIAGARLLILDDAPHGLLWTHADEVNRALLDFLA